MAYVYPYLVVVAYYVWFYIKSRKDPGYRGTLSLCGAMLGLVGLGQLDRSLSRELTTSLNGLFALALLFIPGAIQIVRLARINPKRSKNKVKSPLRNYVGVQIGIIGVSVFIFGMVGIIGGLCAAILPKISRSENLTNFLISIMVSTILCSSLLFLFRTLHKKAKSIDEIFYQKEGAPLTAEEQRAVEIWKQSEFEGYVPFVVAIFVVMIFFQCVVFVFQRPFSEFPAMLLIGLSLGGVGGMFLRRQMLKKLKAKGNENGVAWEVFVALAQKGVIKGSGLDKEKT